MVSRQKEGEEDYLLDIYEAKVRIAIEKWEMAEYRNTEYLLKEIEREEKVKRD